MQYDFDLVGKIGSMALIRREDADIDYNIFSRLGSELKPGMIWVTSGAAEIGRLDYIKRTGHELTCDSVDAKTDYAAQGQSILMEPIPPLHPAGIFRASGAGGTSALQRPGEARTHPQALPPREGAGRDSDCQLQRPRFRRRKPQVGTLQPAPRAPRGA